MVRQIGRAAVTVEYADGRSASSLTADWTEAVRARPELEVPLLECRGNSGGVVGESAWYSRGQLILSPLPPAGPLRLTVDWPAVGMHNVEVVLSGSDIQAAAARVRRFAGGAR